MAKEAGSTAVNIDALVQRIGRTARARSTQEAVWSVLAARSLSVTDNAGFTLDGVALGSPVMKIAADTAQGQLRNNSDAMQSITVSTLGVPEVPPAARVTCATF